MQRKRCHHGVKKSGGCKKKSGRKPRRSRSRRRSRRKSRRRSRKKSRRRSSRRSRKKSRRSPRSRSRKSTYMTLARCKSELKDKIKINMREYNNGKYANRKQAIAVAYSQIKKKYPQCKGKI